MSPPPSPARAREDAYRVLFDAQFRPILGYGLLRVDEFTAEYAEGDYPEAVAEVAPALAGEETGNTKPGVDPVFALRGMLGCH